MTNAELKAALKAAQNDGIQANKALLEANKALAVLEAEKKALVPSTGQVAEGSFVTKEQALALKVKRDEEAMTLKRLANQRSESAEYRAERKFQVWDRKERAKAALGLDAALSAPVEERPAMVKQLVLEYGGTYELDRAKGTLESADSLAAGLLSKWGMI